MGHYHYIPVPLVPLVPFRSVSLVPLLLGSVPAAVSDSSVNNWSLIFEKF